MKITSVFKNHEKINRKYTCQGEGISPPIFIDEIPNDAKTLALIVDDPDAPNGTFVHWVMFNIPIQSEIKEDSSYGKEGINDGLQKGYIGPCPPSGEHRYFFKLYALDVELDLKEESTKQELQSAMQDHILEQAEIIGLYQKT